MANEDNPFTRYNQLVEQPWTPPRDLSMDGLCDVPGGSFITLSDAISLLAFGRTKTVPFEEDPLVEVAHKRVASIVLFAAARDGQLKCFGSFSDQQPESEIPASTFANNVCLGNEDNSLDSDGDAMTMKQFVKWREGQKTSQQWSNVVLDRATFKRWLASKLNVEDAYAPKAKPRRKFEAVQQAIEALWPNGGFEKIPEKSRMNSVRTWLEQNALPIAAETTMKAAFKDKSLKLLG